MCVTHKKNTAYRTKKINCTLDGTELLKGYGLVALCMCVCVCVLSQFEHICLVSVLTISKGLHSALRVLIQTTALMFVTLSPNNEKEKEVKMIYSTKEKKTKNDILLFKHVPRDCCTQSQ